MWLNYMIGLGVTSQKATSLGRSTWRDCCSNVIIFFLLQIVRIACILFGEFPFLNNVYLSSNLWPAHPHPLVSNN